jgi:ribosomal protein L21E
LKSKIIKYKNLYKMVLEQKSLSSLYSAVKSADKQSRRKPDRTNKKIFRAVRRYGSVSTKAGKAMQAYSKGDTKGAMKYAGQAGRAAIGARKLHQLKTTRAGNQVKKAAKAYKEGNSVAAALAAARAAKLVYKGKGTKIGERRASNGKKYGRTM